MKNLIIIIAITLLISCNESDCCYAGDDTLFEIGLFNSSGIDLLDTTNSESIDISKIRILNLRDGEAKIHYQSSSAAPYGYIIYERDSIFRLNPDFDLKDKKEATGFIQWNEDDLDTLDFVLDKEFTRILSIHFNGTEVYNKETSDDWDYKYFKVIK